jgi:methylmalonyl-CoA/ethylmalonyl-CoA epimerase
VFGFKRVDHISMAVWRIDEQLPFFTDLLGLRLIDRWTSEEEGFAGALLEFPGKQINLEILEPLGEDSFVAKFLRERGPGFHHITIETDDVEQAAAAMEAHGIDPFRGIGGGPEFRHTYMHPRQTGGLLWQVFSSSAPRDWQRRQDE